MAVSVSRHKKSRFWAVREPDGTLVCLCVYRKGAQEVRRRLTQRETTMPRPHPGWRTHTRREDP